MADAYKYQPLGPDQIRLLQLHDQPDELRLIQRIFHVTRAECPPYTAISYVWGANQQVGRQDLVCEDPHAKVNVTRNLELALRSVARSKAKAASTAGQENGGQRSYVWADAICINQCENEEKSRQVSMMQEIYQHAEDVHIWLGDGEANTGMAFNLIRELVQPHQRVESVQWTLDSPCHKGDTQTLGMQNEDDLNGACDAFLAILERPWFTRIWIVQEVAAGKSAKVFCGNYSVDWNDLVKAVKFSLDMGLRAANIYGREQILRIAQTRDEYLVSSTGDGSAGEFERLQRLLFRHHGSSSTVPHDMVYALRGLSGMPTIYEEHQRFVQSLMSSNYIPSMADWNEMTKQIDYEKDIEDVYLEVASKVLSECQTLDLLGACTWPRQSAALPSWVPDWSTSRTHRLLRQELESSTSKKFSLSASADFAQYEPRFYDEEGKATETYDSEIILYLGVSGFLIDTIETFASVNDIRVRSLSNEVFQILQGEHWEIATTNGNLVCIVPVEAQGGDRIGLFQGAKTPLLLRRSTDDIDVANEKDHDVSVWKLIGECYVEETMDGSMFDINKCTPIWIS
ncbi:hypothetical protein N0V90_009829 [Kalmusia sp. IMI 367209]|nr:hypothetical protein N0V90_009829 [Kalmusia sp. IMI 367209]